MSNKTLQNILTVACAVMAFAPTPATAQVCGPLDDGRLADAFYEGTVIFWEPLIEYREMVLTIGGPCEDIVKVFRKGEPISFDLREITKVTDGTYTWQLRRVASIDPGVQKDLEASRGTGEEDAVWWNYFQKGAIPAGPYVESASFTVERGVIIDPNQVEGKRATVASRAGGALAGSSLAAALTPGASSAGTAGGNGIATRDQVIPDDLIVQGSACVGFDCVNGESFGFDTIRLKENNTRIQFNDTSVGSFPTGNWQIRANSSSSGGQSFLGFVDQGASGTTETGTLVFAVEAAARANALYVESDGDVGLGTANPVLDFHISTSNTPGIRLEQTNAGGFTAQTWDIAGNEANFFVRDVTGGSTLPFRIRPDAPTSSIDISADGDVGVGTASPSASLHVRRSDGTAQVFVQETSGTGAARTLLNLENNGQVRFRMKDTAQTPEWVFTASNAFQIDNLADAGVEFQVNPNGEIVQNGTPIHPPDYVFEPDYALMSLDDLEAFISANKHLPNVPSATDIKRDGLNLTQMPMRLLEKIEELTLYTLDQHRYIEQLETRLATLEARDAEEGEVTSVSASVEP
jgi:hypothetical protein